MNFLVEPKFSSCTWYMEEMDDRQMTPRGYRKFNSYVKNLHFWYSGQMNRQTETLIRGGLGNLIGSSR
jgi:hypothetical protein